MCNDYRQEVELASIMEDFEDLEINIETPEGMPDDNPRADIRMTEMAPIVRATGAPPGNYRAVGELVSRRWSWPGKKGQVYNFRTEGFGDRPPDLSVNRCLVLCDGFYEFTDPAVPRPKDKRLDKWLFTMDAGDDVRPYHHRQIIPLARDRWADWLNPEVPAEDVLGYLPAGMLEVTQVYPPPPVGPEQASLSL